MHFGGGRGGGGQGILCGEGERGGLLDGMEEGGVPTWECNIYGRG